MMERIPGKLVGYAANTFRKRNTPVVYIQWRAAASELQRNPHHFYNRFVHLIQRPWPPNRHSPFEPSISEWYDFVAM